MAKRLYPYQEVGADWLSTRKYAILGDQMRLGKTPQALSACDYIDAKRVLVVCMAVGRINWVREIQDCCMYQRNVVSPATEAHFKKFAKNICAADELTLVLTYGLITNKNVRKALEGISWDVLILDEGHALKTPTAARTKAIYGPKGIARSASRVWVLSGTIAPNDQSETWTHLKAFGLTDHKFVAFKQKYFALDSWGNPKYMRQSMVDEYNNMLGSVMLRRTRSDVAPNLPNVQVSTTYIAADDEYAKKWFEGVEGLPDVLREQEQILRSMLLGETVALDTESVSTYLKYHGLSKVPAVYELANNFLLDYRDNKLVLFARHISVVQALRDMLVAYNPAVIHGATRDKQGQVDKFREDDTCRVLIGNIDAAGTSIDLSVADDVWFAEPSFVPGNNEQAEMRVMHPRKSKPCNAMYILLSDSLDEVYTRALSRKARMLSQTF